MVGWLVWLECFPPEYHIGNWYVGITYSYYSSVQRETTVQNAAAEWTADDSWTDVPFFPTRLVHFNVNAIAIYYTSWWSHQMQTLSALLAFCEGNSQVIGRFPSRRPVTRSVDVFFDLRLNITVSITHDIYYEYILLSYDRFHRWF